MYYVQNEEFRLVETRSSRCRAINTINDGLNVRLTVESERRMWQLVKEKGKGDIGN